MPDQLAPFTLGAIAAVLIGLSKTGVPGVSIPAILLMAEAFPGNEKLSVGAILPILLVGDVLAVGAYRQHAVEPPVWPVPLCSRGNGSRRLCSHEGR